MEMTDEELRLVQTAKLISRLAHRGQFDKSGKPYYLHPQTVAQRVTLPKEKVVAYLHDVLEDTDVREEELCEIFGEEIVEALVLLTHREGVAYLDYVRSLRGNALARSVKLADLSHNMDLSRIEHPTQKDFDRIETKYKPALAILEADCGRKRK